MVEEAAWNFIEEYVLDGIVRTGALARRVAEELDVDLDDDLTVDVVRVAAAYEEGITNQRTRYLEHVAHSIAAERNENSWYSYKAVYVGAGLAVVEASYNGRIVGYV